MKPRILNFRSALLRKLMIIVCLVTVLTTGLAYAQTTRTVRVAFFPMDGYHIIGSDGSYGGMDVDYLSVLCRYTDWEIEYVPCSSWDHALEMLEAHEVDLVGSAQHSEEREKLFSYADLASGYTYGMIATNADGRIAYEDFDAMRDLTFGMVKSYVRRTEFKQYMADNGVPDPKVLWYADTESLQRALDRGQVDAMVHTFMEVKEGQRIIGRFAPQPIYYITWKGNDAILRELNSAIADVKFHHPDLEANLTHQYYESKLDKTVLLTLEEKEFLRETDSLTVGYLDGHYPFSYTDSETNEFAGLSRYLIEDSLLWTGTELVYRRFESHEEACAALIAGEIDIQAYCIRPESASVDNQLHFLNSYAESPLVLVTNGVQSLDEIKTLATISGFAGLSGKELGLNRPSLVIFDRQKECIDFLSVNAVDAVLCDGYLAENLLRTTWQYQNLEIISVLNINHTVHMVVSQAQDPRLENILMKTISPLDVHDINEYTFEENTYPLLTLNTYIRNNSLVIIALLLLLITAIVAVGVHLLRNSRRIRELMYKDPSMDIWNMNYLYFMGNRQIQSDRRNHYAVVCLNVSKLRRYNIVYGWEAAQQLLEIIKDTLEKCIDDKKEICARNYADRFVLLLTWEDWDAFLDRLEILRQLSEEFIFRETEKRIHIPIGVYAVPSDTNDLHHAVSCANRAMDMAQDVTKYEKLIAVYDDSIDAMVKETHIRESYLEAISIPDHFLVYYQHKVDIRDEKITGAEALVRFRDPLADGLIRSPAYFIPIFEQMGRVVELDFFVLESVCKMLRSRIDQGKRIVPISCNFSRMHFSRPGFPDRFEAILDQYRISKDLVEVEITETLVMEEIEHNTIKETLNIMKERGIRLSIDDFGAGYSSLGTFVQVPASTIKLDRSFLLNRENRLRQLHIMRGIVQMSEALDAQIVCEGVEDENDLEVMRKIDAYVAQGYYYSKPVPQEEFEASLDADS